MGEPSRNWHFRNNTIGLAHAAFQLNSNVEGIPAASMSISAPGLAARNATGSLPWG
jgi:hypothetical protein